MRALRAGVRRLRAPALFLLVGELAARLVAPAPAPWMWPQTRFRADPTLGFRMQPNQKSYTAEAPFHTNSLGLRGREPATAKPSGRRRVLILGDSIASGFGVAEKDTFPRRLEGLLNAVEPRRYEVLNAGVPSYNTAQQVGWLVEQGLALGPDIVVLALYWNDIHDKAGIAVDGEGRLVEAHTSGAPSLLHSRAAYRVRNWVKRSRLFYMVVDRSRRLVMRYKPPLQRETQLAVLEGGEHPRVERGWEAVEAHLARFAAVCRARGIRPLVLILPMPQQLGENYPRVRYQSVARRICDRHSLPWHDLLPAFEKAYRDHTSLFLAYDGDHPNNEGHALIAGELFAALRFHADLHSGHLCLLP